ncbi:hypothetical protein PILCRDRAFT_815741 [Piloderma croceum F 1598]|uniref:Glucose receptor Git3-like N-terminal domain-containing protein n=1 Tax=Piloderma croceum (strain F 1598) TaxID=765440 RepID=A0A0C3BJH9_PILCF|nr:hypothetical protein PILCRDRAFT_815741 [Piloderma croceum F 1598]
MPSASITGVRLAASIIEFIGSTSSFLGASFMIVCYLLLPMKRHFRHTLILNLAVSDAVNGLCEALSGLHILIHRVDIKAGPACTINGLIGQLTNQATDTTIFTMTCVTVYTITRRSLVPAQWPRRTILLTCIAIWTFPIITSFTALGMNWYGPVSGNWCWLVEKPAYIRYVLTHMWRFLFIFLEIGLYTYLHIYLKRRFNNTDTFLADAETGALNISPTRSQMVIDTSKESSVLEMSTWDKNDQSSYNSYSYKQTKLDEIPPHSLVQLTKLPLRHIMAHRRTDDLTHHRNARLVAIEKVLLLNAYPLLYIILWIPGLANRLAEAFGHSPKVLMVMQSTTQFVGLANAFTFGWNEEVARQLKHRFGN